FASSADAAWPVGPQRGSDVDRLAGDSGRFRDRADRGSRLRRSVAASVYGAVLCAGSIVPDGSIVRRGVSGSNRRPASDRAHHPELRVQASLRGVDSGCGLVAAAYFGAMMMRFDFDLSIAQVDAMLIGLPWVVMIGCGAFLVSGVYRGIWRYTGLAESVRFALAAMIAGLAVKLASAIVPITISR